MSEDTDRTTKLIPLPAWFRGGVQLIRDVGFPIAVCAFLLISLNPKVDMAIKMMERQTTILEILLKQK